MDFFAHIQEVTSWVGLLAFVFAIAGSLIYLRLSLDLRLVEKAPDSHRAKLILKSLDKDGIDASRLSREQVFKLLEQKIRQRKLPWLVGTIVALLLALVVIVGLLIDKGNSKAKPEERSYIEPARSHEVLILVANFDGPDPLRYRLSETLISNLTRVLSDSSIRIEGLGRAITPTNGGGSLARLEGKRLGASIVIWGWYALTPLAAPVNVNFEVLKPDSRIQGCTEASFFRKSTVEDLQSFKLQTQISEKLAPQILLAAGIASYLADDLELSIARFSKALDVSDHNDSHLIALLHSFRGAAFEESGKNFQAVYDYSESVKAEPSASAYKSLGAIYKKSGDPDLAIEYYSAALKKDPANVEAILGRGLAYESRGRIREAIEDYKRTLVLDENGLITGVMEDLREVTERELDSKIKHYPDHVAALLLRAYMYQKDRKFEKAINDYKAIIKEVPDVADVYFELGVSYAGSRKFVEAVQAFDKAISINPRHVCSYIGMAYMKNRQGRSGLEYLDRAVSVAPYSAHVHSVRGSYYLKKLHNPGAALVDFSDAIELDPGNSDNYTNRGLLYFRRGRLWAAWLDFRKALVLNPEDTTALLNVRILIVFALLAGALLASLFILSKRMFWLGSDIL
jgi:tetratricopeptide (TPR) repeat protein